MAETVEVKARRYLAEGRLAVEHVDLRGIRARCRGGGAVYELGYGEVEPGLSGWFCGCPAFTRCAHLVALQLVTVRPSVAPARVHERADA